MLRTKPVGDRKVGTTVSAVEQVRTRSERHNLHIAALHENSQRAEVTLEFLAHLAFNQCGDNVMKLLRKHPHLYDLNLGPINRVVDHAKHCTGCLVANRLLGAHAAYKHGLTKNATEPGECYLADVPSPIRPWVLGGPSASWWLLTRTHVSCMSCQCAEMHKQRLCLHNCLNASGYKLSGSTTTVYASCILIKGATLCLVALSPFVLGAESCTRFQTQLHTSPMV